MESFNYLNANLPNIALIGNNKHVSELPKRSLVFLIDEKLDEKRVLLAMKKRGFGAGLWNGAGGKPEPGETIEETAVRECREEINVTPIQLSLMGILNFYFAP